MKTREDFLNKAEELINGPRAKEYGPAKFNHERIATIWSVVLGRSKDDSWVDIIGYAALGGEIVNDCDDS